MLVALTAAPGCSSADLAQEFEACSKDGDCAEGLACKGGSCQSLVRTTCLIDAQCPEGQKCTEGSCQANEPPAQCEGDGDCDDGMLCDQGLCVAGEPVGCESDEECAKDEACEDGKCVASTPEGCTEDEDCESGDCDEDSGECVGDEPECSEDGDCPEPADACTAVECADFVCVTGPLEDCCTEDLQCNDDNPLTDDACVDNICINLGKTCTYDADCNDLIPCTIDTCKAGHCENVASADPLCCVSNDDCDDGKEETADICIDNQCTFKNVMGCETDADCVDSNSCTTEKCNQQVCETSPVVAPECACVSDADCFGKGNTCVIVQTGLASLGTYCNNPVGPKLGGEECALDSECKSGFCLDFDDGNICFGGCNSNLDCHGATECGTVTFTVGTGNEVPLPTCVTMPPGCGGDVDCIDDLVCVPVINPDVPNTLIGYCGPADGAKAGGQLCAADNECETGICFDLFEKGIEICWSSCVNDEDCAPGLNCYPNLAYFLFDQDTPDKADDKYWSLGSCTPFLGSFNNCMADSDCPGGEYCSTYKNQTMTALEPHCITAVGATQPGAACTADSQCKSGWCTDPPGGICIGLCKTDSDCFGGTTCQNYPDFQINDKEDTVPVNICLP